MSRGPSGGNPVGIDPDNTVIYHDLLHPHQKGKTIVCPSCNETLTKNREAKNHLIMHEERGELAAGFWIQCFRVCHMCKYYTIQKVNLESHIRIRHSRSNHNIPRRTQSIARETEVFLPVLSSPYDPSALGPIGPPVRAQNSVTGRELTESRYAFHDIGLGSGARGRNSQGLSGFTLSNWLPQRHAVFSLHTHSNGNSFQHLFRSQPPSFPIPISNYPQQRMLPEPQQPPLPYQGIGILNGFSGENTPAYDEHRAPFFILPPSEGSYMQWDLMDDASSFYF